MATFRFDLREALMEINEQLAKFNAMRNDANAKNLQVNYQILHISLKNLVNRVREVYTEFGNEMIEENKEMIKLISKNCLENCSKEYRESQEKTDSKSQVAEENNV